MLHHFPFNPHCQHSLILLRYFVGWKFWLQINSKSVTVAEKNTLSTVLIVQKRHQYPFLPKIEHNSAAFQFVSSCYRSQVLFYQTLFNFFLRYFFLNNHTPSYKVPTASVAGLWPHQSQRVTMKIAWLLSPQRTRPPRPPFIVHFAAPLSLPKTDWIITWTFHMSDKLICPLRIGKKCKKLKLVSSQLHTQLIRLCLNYATPRSTCPPIKSSPNQPPLPRRLK